MAALLIVALLARPAFAEPLSERVDREFVQPVLEQVQGAVEGRQPDWVPPTLPGSAMTLRLEEDVRVKWLGPLLAAHQAYAFDAARSLASPEAFDAPAEPAILSAVPDASLSAIVESLVAELDRSVAAAFFPADAPRPGASRSSETELAPRDLLAQPRDFARTRAVSDSSRLTRRMGAGPSRPRLKAKRPRFSPVP